MYSEQDLKALLSMSFLGDSQWYVLKDFSELTAVVQKKYYSYLTSYTGPHHVVCIVDETFEIKDSLQCIDISGELSRSLFSRLCLFIHPGASHNPHFVNTLFEYCKSISLDVAFMFVHYAQFLGRNQDLFFKTWLQRIIEPESSLFTLSQHFFAKDVTRFLGLWSKMMKLYPDEFWVSYWSEQLWQAAIFLQMADKRDLSLKKFVNRLPFSFMQKDWRLYSLDELKQAHSFLYDTDFQLKNGAGSGGVDLFCLKFVTGQFKKS